MQSVSLSLKLEKIDYLKELTSWSMTPFITENFTICFSTGYLTGTITTIKHSTGYMTGKTINILIIIQGNTKTITFVLVERAASSYDELVSSFFEE